MRNPLGYNVRKINQAIKSVVPFHAKVCSIELTHVVVGADVARDMSAYAAQIAAAIGGEVEPPVPGVTRNYVSFRLPVPVK